MAKFLAVFSLWIALAGGALAHGFSGLARVDMSRSGISGDEDELRIELGLSQVVPWRIYTLAEPLRVIVDFREVNWGDVTRSELVQTDHVVSVAYGSVRPGWSRMVIELEQPMRVDLAGLKTKEANGSAQLSIVLLSTDLADFMTSTGAPSDHDYSLPRANEPDFVPRDRLDRPLVIALDPGHGGIDPGAERDGTREAHLMLTLAREIADTLMREGNFEVVLTRYGDEFVPLSERMTRARAEGAQVFLSLHADALEEGNARGATIYTLSDEASDTASQKMAERHSRGDLLAGLDLSGQDDRVTTALLDLVRRETEPRSLSLAETLVANLRAGDVPVNSRPLRSADIAVLRAADIPSALIEVGFLSDDGDLERLRSTEGRAALVRAIVAALSDWERTDAQAAGLVRQ